MQRTLEFAVDNRLPEIRSRLGRIFPRRDGAPTDPLRQLIYGVLCDGLAPAAALAVFNRVKLTYPNWARLRDAEPAALEAILVGVPRAAQKAIHIPAILREIEERAGDLDLDHLGRLSTESAQRWLEQLPGVTATIARAVLAFSTLGRPVVPVDSDSATPARRLGLAPAGVPISALPRHILARSPASWGTTEFSDLSRLLKQLGRRLCRRDNAACADCILSDLCPSAKRPTAQIIAFKPR